MNPINVTLTGETRVEIAVRLACFLSRESEDLAMSEMEVLLAVMFNLGNLSQSMGLVPAELITVFQLGHDVGVKGEI